jgi:thioredoxin reductase (NADPH)
MSNYDMIIVGAGPAGISMAVEAVKAGICSEKILILEKGEAHAWSIQKLYQENKLVTANFKGQAAVCHGVMCIGDLSKKETLNYLDKAIYDYQLSVHYEEEVSSIHQLKKEKGFQLDTSKGEYKAKVCVIAIGIFGRPNKPNLKLPASLKEKFHYDITSTPIENSKVLVVGGGDSASEYVQFLHEKNNQVTLSYRKNEFNRMNDINRDSIIMLRDEHKVNIYFSSNISEIVEEGGKAKVFFNEDNYEVEIFDHVVFALGGTTPQNFLKLIGIEFDGVEPLVDENNETNISGLYLIGDLSAGKKGGSIISAFNSAVKAMDSVCEGYLDCQARVVGEGKFNFS